MKCVVYHYVIPTFLVLLSCSVECKSRSGNLSCYQCIRDTNTECTPEEFLPCPAVSDRCVTHVSKNHEQGFAIKRECGLGPCGFQDDMVNKGLGFDHCDRSRDEYFCIFCCRDSGCNKNNSISKMPSMCLIFIASILLYAILNAQ